MCPTSAARRVGIDNTWVMTNIKKVTADFKLVLHKRGVKGKLPEVTVVTMGLMTRIIATGSTDTDSIPSSIRKVLKIEFSQNSPAALTPHSAIYSALYRQQKRTRALSIL